LVASIPRAFWVILGVMGLILAVVTGIVGWGLSPENLKSRLAAEVERATGRTLTIAGRASVEFSLVPTISLENVTLSNPPGFSRPDMLRIARLEVSLSLVPLLRHRIEIDRLTLIRPDILLETDKAGRRNWALTREPTAQPQGAATASSGSSGEGFTLSFTDSRVTDGHAAFLDGATGHRVEAGAPGLILSTPEDGPPRLTGTLSFEGQTIGLTGRTGPMGSMQASPGAWPVKLELESNGATASVAGQIARPRDGHGYSFTIDTNVPDPAAFATLFPGWPVALLKSVTAHAAISDDGSTGPALGKLDLKIGSVDLGTAAPGARLEDVTLSGEGMAPMQVAARVAIPGVEYGIAGTAGDLAWLWNGASGPVAVDLEWNAASARTNFKGTIQQPLRLAGFDLEVTGNVPNPALVTDRAPPALKSVTFQTKLTDTPGPVPFHIASNAGDLSGELSVSRQPHLSIAGHIASGRLDLDTLKLPPPAAATGPAAEPVAASGTTPLIPDTKLPFDLIRATDANVTVALAQVHLGGADIGGLDAVLSIKDGILRLDPVTLSTNGQKSVVSLLADGTSTPPAVHLTVQAPVLPVGSLLAALGLPRVANGTAAVRADVTGSGDTPRAIAASLDGWAGVAIEGGQLDAKQVNAWLARLQPLRIEGADVTELRCLAARADAKAGVVTLQPMALNTAALIVDGSGEVDLGHETLALRVRPRTKIGGTGIAVPVRVSGPMGAPSAKIDMSSGGGPAGALAGLLLGGKEIMGAAGGGDPCPAALARARDGAPVVTETPPAPGGKN
jgi:uncharacterized protein involved in outer membrane biogenesis